MVAEVKGTLTTTHNNTNTVTEIICRASSQNDAEQLAHAALADDSAPRRTLHQDLSLTGLTDTTVETFPDVVHTFVDTPCALHTIAVIVSVSFCVAVGVALTSATMLDHQACTAISNWVRSKSSVD